MPSFATKADLRVKPLRIREREWIVSLEKVLMRCPKRIELVTTGDACLHVVDKDGASQSELCDGSAARDGIVLADVMSACLIHGVSG